MCCGTWGLEVERDHLAAGVPEDLRHVITGVHAAPFGVDTAHLTLVVAAVMLRNFLFIFFKRRVRACVFQRMCGYAFECLCMCVSNRLQDYF